MILMEFLIRRLCERLKFRLFFMALVHFGCGGKTEKKQIRTGPTKEVSAANNDVIAQTRG